MGQIVKRKKKGRPSKADLASRADAGVNGSPAPESDIRRSLRRRNVKYNIDYDDYLDEYEEYDVDEDEEEEERENEKRREKKLKLVLKQLPTTDRSGGGGGDSDSGRVPKGAREINAHESQDGYGDRRTNRKMKMEAGDDNDEDEDNDDGGDDEEKRRKGESKGHDSVPGTPFDPSSGVSLPDKKNLELILDKLQKKDIYGVYAEPVDPEELPDYHEIIEHPMDFATVRKKLNNASYSTLEQLESDVYLICSNAMQYNAPDTIYYKQARTIHELARKKFLKVRIIVERSEKELKSEQKTISNSLPKKQIKRFVCRTSQEPVGSDFSSGATLATGGDVQNNLNVTQPGGSERPNNVDGFIEGNSSLVDNNLEKAEEVLSGKGLLSKFGRKPVVMDENRRTTYNISCQPTTKSDSIYTTLEGEHKQLVAVGLHAEYSYARSLARFAATLGPFAWKAASKRIEQGLPEGFKFGRGWVGEYEPLPTPVLMIENHNQKEPALFRKLQCTTGVRTENRTFNTSELPATGSTLVGKPSSFRSAGGASIEGKPSFFGLNGTRPSAPVNAVDQQQKPSSKIHAAPDNKTVKQVELKFPPTANQNKVNVVAEKSLSISPKMAASMATEPVPRDMNLRQTVPVKKQTSNGTVSVRLPNGKVTNNSLDNNRLASSSSESVPNQMARVGTYSPHMQEQSLGNPAQLMRVLAGKAQKQQTSSNNSPRDSSPVMSSVSSSRRDDSNNAAAAAARAWMSIGAGGFKPGTENSNPHRSQISADSLYNPARELHPQLLRFRGEFPISGGMHFPSEQNSFPVQAFVPQPVRMATEAQFQNRPIVFPHLVTADLSRFQMQTPWRGLSPHTQPRQKQDTLPPDLNISFQSSGSPVRQSAGVLVDSQQPDLALQL